MNWQGTFKRSCFQNIHTEVSEFTNPMNRYRPTRRCTLYYNKVQIWGQKSAMELKCPVWGKCKRKWNFEHLLCRWFAAVCRKIATFRSQLCWRRTPLNSFEVTRSRPWSLHCTFYEEKKRVNWNNAIERGAYIGCPPRTLFGHIWALIWSGVRGNIARTAL